LRDASEIRDDEAKIHSLTPEEREVILRKHRLISDVERLDIIRNAARLTSDKILLDGSNEQDAEISKRSGRHKGIDPFEAKKLHDEENKSFKQIADALGCSCANIHKMFKSRGWIQLESSGKSDIDPAEIWKLYYGEKLSLEKVANELGYKSASPIKRVIWEQGWQTRSRYERPSPVSIAVSDAKEQHTKEIGHEEVFRLYFGENMFLKDIAEVFHTYPKKIKQVFIEHGKHLRPRKREIDSEDVYRLYVVEQESMCNIALKLRTSEKRIRETLLEHRLEIRHTEKIYDSEIERQQAKKERYRRRIEEIRESLFGVKCGVCGRTKLDSERERGKNSLVIHRKDGQEHDENALRRVEFLTNVNPEEWIALCLRCHRGVHWVMNRYGYDWEQIEARRKSSDDESGRLSPKALTIGDVLGLPIVTNIRELSSMSVNEVRDAIFGHKCNLCKSEKDIRRIAIHRKDGVPHDDNILWNKDSLIRLNPIEWSVLCQKCHNYVHWCMDHLHLD
jgi:hypothetical protein